MAIKNTTTSTKKTSTSKTKKKVSIFMFLLVMMAACGKLWATEPPQKRDTVIYIQSNPTKNNYSLPSNKQKLLRDFKSKTPSEKNKIIRDFKSKTPSEQQKILRKYNLTKEDIKNS